MRFVAPNSNTITLSIW